MSDDTKHPSGPSEEMPGSSLHQPPRAGPSRRWHATKAVREESPVLLNIDELDSEIIRLLQIDGRTPTAQMARDLKVSEPTIRKRFDRLLAAEIIKVTAVINPHKTGFGLDIIFGIHTHPGYVSAVAQQFSVFPQVTYVGQTIGLYDIFVNMLFRDDDDLRSFLSSQLPSFRGISSYETLHVLYTERLDFDWTMASPQD